MPTDLDFVNSSLALIGKDRIPSLTNTTNNATIETANFFLPSIKPAVLRAHDWNCARRRAALVEVADASFAEWERAYRLPPDCLAVRRFAHPDNDIKHSPFSVELGADDKPILYCNLENAKIVYTKNFPDVNRWDALLYDAGRYRLAIDFATTFMRDLKFMQGLWAIYKDRIEEAGGVNESEGGIERVHSQSLTDIRG